MPCCPPSPPRAQVADCFVIALDREVALLAAAGNASALEDFFWGELVLSEGAPLQCSGVLEDGRTPAVSARARARAGGRGWRGGVAPLLWQQAGQ